MRGNLRCCLSPWVYWWSRGPDIVQMSSTGSATEKVSVRTEIQERIQSIIIITYWFYIDLIQTLNSLTISGHVLLQCLLWGFTVNFGCGRSTSVNTWVLTARTGGRDPPTTLLFRISPTPGNRYTVHLKNDICDSRRKRIILASRLYRRHRRARWISKITD